MKRALWQKREPGIPRCSFEGRVRQPRPSHGKIGPKGKILSFAADAGQGPVCFSGMDHEQQVIGARLLDGRAEGHAHREFEDPAFSGGGDGFHDDSLGPQLGGLSCNRRLDKGTSDGQRVVEGPIIGTRAAIVEDGFEAFQQERQGQVREQPGWRQGTIVHQVDGQDGIGVERGMDHVQIPIRNTERPQILPAEVPPDQAERAVGLAVVAQGWAFLVVIEDQLLRIVIAADVTDHPVRRRRGSSRITRPHDPRLWEKPRQDNGGEKLVSVKATGMGDEIFAPN